MEEILGNVNSVESMGLVDGPWDKICRIFARV